MIELQQRTIYIPFGYLINNKGECVYMKYNAQKSLPSAQIIIMQELQRVKKGQMFSNIPIIYSTNHNGYEFYKGTNLCEQNMVGALMIIPFTYSFSNQNECLSLAVSYEKDDLACKVKVHWVSDIMNDTERFKELINKDKNNNYTMLSKLDDYFDTEKTEESRKLLYSSECYSEDNYGDGTTKVNYELLDVFVL